MAVHASAGRKKLGTNFDMIDPKFPATDACALTAKFGESDHPRIAVPHPLDGNETEPGSNDLSLPRVRYKCINLNSARIELLEGAVDQVPKLVASR